MEPKRRIFVPQGPRPTQTDLLLVTFPRRNPHMFYAPQLPEALARLKACAQEAGFSAFGIDFDNTFFRKAVFEKSIYAEMDEYFRNINDRAFVGMRTKLLGPAALEYYEKYLDDCVEQMCAIECEWLGVSIFTEQSIRASFDILEKYRARKPKTKVVIGGYCMITWAYHHGGHHLSEKKAPRRIGEFAKELGLCDHFIVGEGEKSLIELMRGNKQYPGIDQFNPSQITDLDALPIPDYTDFDFRHYIYPNPNDLKKLLFPMLSVTGSRGCIRRCSFCDIAAKWPKYRWVNPVKLGEEIISYSEKYGVRNFHWSDSLVNASPRHMDQTMAIVGDYLEKTHIEFWQTGAFIIKEPEHMGEAYYARLARAGFKVLVFGVESGSEACRKTMNKSFTNRAIRFTVEMCRKYNLEAQFLIMLGYPTETENDFYETLKLMQEFRPRFKGDQSVAWSLSSFGYEYDADESPLNRDPAMYHVTHDPVLGWQSPVSSHYEALLRTNATYEFLESLSYPSYEEWRHENEIDLKFLEKNIREAGRSAELRPAYVIDPEVIRTTVESRVVTDTLDAAWKEVRLAP